MGILLIVEGIVISVMLLHPLNAFSPKYVFEEGIFKLVNFEQNLKQSFSISIPGNFKKS